MLEKVDLTLLYIVGPIVGFLLCIAGGIVAYFRCFVVDRTKVPTFSLQIKYYTENPNVKLENIQFKSRINKIRRRNQRLRRLNEFLRAKRVQPQNDDSKEGLSDEVVGFDDDSDIEDGNDSGSNNEFRHHDPRASSKSSILRRSMLFLRSSFLNIMSFEGYSQKSGSFAGSPSSKSPKKRSKSRSSSFFSQAGMETSTKSKRFISQDRLDRAEARKALFASTIEDAEPEVVEDITEEFDEERERQKRIQAIIERRKKNREEEKIQAIERGEIDVVALNAGPKPHEVPKGFTVLEFIPDLNPEFLVYKRVLYKYEDPTKAEGWFLGTIVGTSKVPGKNFNIKYDRAETGTRFVDGVQTVSLTLEGENSYGRRWVVIEWKGPGKRPGKVLAILAKNGNAEV